MPVAVLIAPLIVMLLAVGVLACTPTKVTAPRPTPTVAPSPTAAPSPTRTPARKPQSGPPTRTGPDDPRWRFFVDDRTRYRSPWFEGAQRIMIGYGCTEAPFYVPDRALAG